MTNRVKRFRIPALVAAALLIFGTPSAPGVSLDLAPSLGDAWATPCDADAGPEDSTSLADSNDPCNEDRHILTEILAWLWTAVNTALGLIYGAMAGVYAWWAKDVTLSVYYDNRAVNFEGAAFLGPNAMVLGNTIHYRKGQNPRANCLLREHEGYHVLQYQRMGPAFIPIYVLVSISTGYQAHPMEEEAQQHAAEQCP